MAKRRTKEQKIKAQHHHEAVIQPIAKSDFTYSSQQTVSQNLKEKNTVADLLMSKPTEIKSDLVKTVVVTGACLICLAAWYWKLKVAGL